jgi:L-Ala-D/L-Glu epimerase
MTGLVRPPGREVVCSAESWELTAPISITGHTFTAAHLLHVTIIEDGVSGQGEGAGVYYLGETADTLLADVETVRVAVQAGADRQALRELLRPGGARNALDCALWDLEAKRQHTTIWALTGIEPRTMCTALTIGIGSPAAMAAAARSIDGPRIKLKLDGELAVERVAAVRSARPDAEILVDVNQGWTFEQLSDYAPQLAALGVAMIEQPLPRGGDAQLEGYRPAVPLCADESCLDVSEFAQAARRYQILNIKLDKAGGLTEALDLARLAQAAGMELMVGNMMGTSLAMAPGFVVAQLCRFVDLDGALFLKHDRQPAMAYRHGMMSSPSPQLWG